MFVLSHSSRLRAVITAMAVVIAGFAFVSVATPAHAAGDSTWTGASSTLWSDPANWAGGLPPADADVVFPASATRKTVVNDVLGGTSVGSVVVSGAGYTISGNALTVTAGVSSNYASGTSAIDLNVLGSGSLTVGGGGVLEVNGALSGPVVLAGGTLSGTGTLNGAGITGSSDSRVDPGPSGTSGSLRYSANAGLNLPAYSTYHVDLNGPTVGTGYDQLRLTSGSALFNPNAATLDIELGYLPAVNTSFQIVSQTYASPITGRFNGISQFGSVTSGPVTFSVGYFNSGIILTVVAVNVPTLTWDGGGTTTTWSDAANWSGDVAPSFAAALVFPTGVAKRASVNDLAPGFQVSALTIAAPGYEVSGNSVGLAGGLIANSGSGTSTISLPLVISATRTVEVSAGGTLEIAAPTTGSGGLTKTSAGTLRITGTSSYTGPTVVSAGRLAVDTSLATSSSVEVAAGATLSGDGTLPAVSVSGRLQPGILTTGALTLASSAETTVAITEDGASRIDVTGAVTIVGSALVTELAFVPTLGSTFALVRNDGVDAVTGTFDGLDEGATYVVGGATMQISYIGGDGNDIVLTVVQVPTATALTSSDSATVSGESVTFTATTTTDDGTAVPSGTVRFLIGGEQVQAPATVDEDGEVTFTTSALPVGETTVVAEYAGSTGYADSSDSLDHTVGAAATATILSAPSGPFVAGASVDLAATVTATAPGAGTPSGSVSFYDGATLLGVGTLNGSGVATFTTSDLAVGSHSLTAVFAGATGYTTSTSAAVTRTVAKRQTTLVVTAGPSTSYGESVTFTATVTDADVAVAGGSVRFLVGGVEVQVATPVNGAGRATYTTSTLPVGEATVTAEYVGTATLAGSTGSVTHIVTPVAAVRVNPTISARLSSSTPKSKAGWYRKAVRITFTCTPGSAALASPCPATVTLGRSGKDRVVRRGITARDGGTATVRVVLSIDRKAPTLKVKRHGNKLRCLAKDARSGVASCTITKKTRAGVVRWVATATDRAGNVTKRKGRFHKR